LTTRPHLLPLAVAGEGALALAGGVWMAAAGIPMRLGSPGTSIGAGLGMAAGLAVVQWWLLRGAPAWGLVRSWRAFYRDVLAPTFGQLSAAEIIAISLLAGIGEEWLFRGAMQAAWGWLAASLAFGLCHVGGRGTWPLGIWAGLTGAGLGWLLTATGGLLAPIVAHAAYDAMALAYIRWGPPLPEDT
jgi:uncharacterized protein